MALFQIFQKDPNELLKKATAQKKSGDIDSAIKTLREAYKAISKTRTVYSVETFLRLPMYLQEAGRSSEAWDEFILLLKDGFPNEIKNSELIPMKRSLVYGKMRLFLQRERKEKQAVAYGVLSHVNWCIGLHNQSRKKELRSCLAKKSISDMVGPLAKKADVAERQPELVKVVRNHLDGVPSLDQARLANEVDNIVGAEENT